MSNNNSEWFLSTNGWGAFIWMIILALIIWLIILLLSQRNHKASEDKKSALKALDELFAKGEIDKAEYLRRKAILNKESKGLL